MLQGADPSRAQAVSRGDQALPQQKFVGWCNQEQMLRRLDIEESMPVTLAGGWQMQMQKQGLVPVFGPFRSSMTAMCQEQRAKKRGIGRIGVAKVLLVYSVHQDARQVAGRSWLLHVLHWSAGLLNLAVLPALQVGRPRW